MSQDAKYAFISDCITGFIEDPLFLIAGLNVSPEIVPAQFVDMLKLDFSDKGLEELKKLCVILNQKKNIKLFNELFQSIFEKQYHKVLNSYFYKSKSLEDVLELIFKDAVEIKENFLRPIVFPINNQYVCHADWIKHNVIDKLIDKMGREDANNFLLSINEPELLNVLIAENYFSKEDSINIYPSLDYTSSCNSIVKKFINIT